jgi:hypothetical protein
VRPKYRRSQSIKLPGFRWSSTFENSQTGERIDQEPQRVQPMTAASGGTGSQGKPDSVTPMFYDPMGYPISENMSLGEALQAGEDASRAMQAASGTNNEYGVATIEGRVTSDGTLTYFNSLPVTSNSPDSIRWNVTGLDTLVSLNHSHPNNFGFSGLDKKAYKDLRKTRAGFRGVYMFDGSGNHWYGPKRKIWGPISTRTHSCGGAAASTWSCPAVGGD